MAVKDQKRVFSAETVVDMNVNLHDEVKGIATCIAEVQYDITQPIEKEMSYERNSWCYSKTYCQGPSEEDEY